LNDLVTHVLAAGSQVLKRLKLLFEVLMEGFRFVLAEYTEDVSEGGGLDGAHEGSAVLGANQLAHPPQTAPHRRIEVVLYAIVSPKSYNLNLPGMFSAITVHLFP
jgi:hypothetical protein